MTWIANLLIIAGLYLAGNKNKFAFAFTFIGEVIWSTAAASRGQWDLTFICGVFAILAAVNLIKWNK